MKKILGYFISILLTILATAISIPFIACLIPLCFVVAIAVFALLSFCFFADIFDI